MKRCSCKTDNSPVDERKPDGWTTTLMWNENTTERAFSSFCVSGEIGNKYVVTLILSDEDKELADYVTALVKTLKELV